MINEFLTETQPTLCFIHLYCLYLVHQIIGAPLGDVLGKHLLVVRKVLCKKHRKPLTYII